MIAWRLLGPGAIGYDAAYSIVWGDDIRHLRAPDFGAPLSPTPHPLANLAGAFASLGGAGHAPALLLALSYLSFGALGVAAFLAGKRGFGTATGVAFAAILLTRPAIVGATLQASIDVPFLALVLLAVAIELGGRGRGRGGGADRRPVAVLAVLAIAGLLRPEAWLLSLAYAAFALHRDRLPRAGVLRLAALAVAAPLAWLAADLLLTGDPLFSLTGTRDLAERLERDRSVGSALRDIPTAMRVILGETVAWTGVIAAAVTLAVAEARARLPIALLTLGLAGFLALGVADLPLLVRYLLVPAAMLALFAAAGLGAFEWLPYGWVATGAVAVVLALGVASTHDDLRDQRRAAAAAGAVDRSLLRAARAAPPDCGPVATSTYRSVPVLARRLGLDPSDIRVIHPAQARGGVVFAASPQALAGDLALTVVPAEQLRLPRGFEQLFRDPWWTAGARC